MAQNITIKDYDTLDQALLILGKNEAAIAKEEAKMNEKIQTIRDDFELKTAHARAEAELVRARIEDFIFSNKRDFEKERSRELIHGSVGFRTGTPKVTLLNKKYNLKTAMELIKKIFNGSYVRTKEEIDKEKILVDYREKTVDDSKLAAVGLKVDQDEKAFVEIKWDSLK
jgi:phage host-nuclease inhibitor protein Gam